MKKFAVGSYEFIISDLKGAKAVFSTAKNDLNFNKTKSEGRKNIENLRQWFKLKNIGYLNQIHGCNIVNYSNNVEDADGIITNRPYTAIGVFNADCVPVLIYDEKKKVIAAAHSGWRGTLSCIVSRTIEKLKEEYGSKAENLKVCVGPHIHSCCYEVGEELKNKFKADPFYRDKSHIFNGRNLDLKRCILYQLEEKGVKVENINYPDICTVCSKELQFYSYRRDKGAGRMFSFIYLDSFDKKADL